MTICTYSREKARESTNHDDKKRLAYNYFVENFLN